MKKSILALLVGFAMIPGIINAQMNRDGDSQQYDSELKTVEFKLQGNRGECANLGNVITVGDGIISTNYNWLNRSLEVKYDSDRTGIGSIRDKLASAGFELAEVEGITEEPKPPQEHIDMVEEEGMETAEIAIECRYRDE